MCVCVCVCVRVCSIASVWYNNANGVFTVKAPTNSAMVIKADIPFCKGYIHVIDTVSVTPFTCMHALMHVDAACSTCTHATP